MSSRSTAGSGTRPDRYLSLVDAFPLHPIRSDAELDRAVEVIDSLILRGDLDEGEADYLSVLGDLVEKYEAVAIPIVPTSDGDVIRDLLQAGGLSPESLCRESGIAPTTLAGVLAGKKELPRRHISSIAKVFKVSPSIFRNA